MSPSGVVKIIVIDRGISKLREKVTAHASFSLKNDIILIEK